MRFLVLLIAVCAVGSAALMARAGLEAGMSAIGLSAWRLTVASVCLVVWLQLQATVKQRTVGSNGYAASSSAALPLPSEGEVAERWLACLAGVFMALHFATWIASLSFVSVARSTLLVATAPLWAGIAGLFVPSLRPKPVFWLGLVLAGAGTWAITSQGAPWHDVSRAWIGDLLATTGAICLVPYFLISQRLQPSMGWLRTITWIYAAAAVFLWVVAFATGTASVPTGPAAWGSILGMGLVAQLVGHSALNWSLNHFTAGQVAMATLLEPVVAAALAWPIFGEPITLWQGVGGLVLLVGVGVALSSRAPAPLRRRDAVASVD